MEKKMMGTRSCNVSVVLGCLLPSLCSVIWGERKVPEWAGICGATCPLCTQVFVPTSIGNLKWALSSFKQSSCCILLGSGHQGAAEQVGMCPCGQETSPCWEFPGAGDGGSWTRAACQHSLLLAQHSSSAQNWRNPKNALHALGHALQRSEKINSRNISKSRFIFFPYSGPDFTFPRVSNHYFLLLPLVFHLFSFLTLAQELQYVICLSGGTKIVLLYRLVLQHRMSLACQGCKHRVNPAFHGLHFPCTCLFHILCLPQDGSNCLTFDNKVRGITHLEAKM